MSDTHAALLTAIKARPDDDTPRLVFADWCDDNGEPERAAFVRVQCEIARIKDCGHAARGSWYLDGSCRTCPVLYPLRERERVLLYATPPDRDLTYKYVWFDPTDRWPGVTHEFARGFVERVECSASEWMRYADALLAEHPVRRATLTTWPGETVGWMAEAAMRADGGVEYDDWPGVLFQLPSYAGAAMV